MLFLNMFCAKNEDEQAMIGKTTVVNPGYGREGKAAVIELGDVKPKIERIRFVRIK